MNTQASRLIKAIAETRQEIRELKSQQASIEKEIDFNDRFIDHFKKKLTAPLQPKADEIMGDVRYFCSISLDDERGTIYLGFGDIFAKGDVFSMETLTQGGRLALNIYTPKASIGTKLAQEKANQLLDLFLEQIGESELEGSRIS